jgi:hypothetical protein
VRHHVRLEHLDQRLGALQRHNVLVDDIAFVGVLGRRRAADSRVFWERLLDERPGAALQAEEILHLLLERLNASGGVSGRPSRRRASHTSLALLNYRGVERGGTRSACPGAHICCSQSRHARRTAGSHLSQMSWRCVRSQRIFSEKQFWQVLESSCAAEEPLAGSSAPGGARDILATSTGTTPCAGGHGEASRASSSADTRRERIVGAVHMCVTGMEPRDVTTLPRLGRECDCSGCPLSRDAAVMTTLDLHRAFFQKTPLPLFNLPLTHRPFIVPRSRQSRVGGACQGPAALCYDRRVYAASPPRGLVTSAEQCLA